MTLSFCAKFTTPYMEVKIMILVTILLLTVMLLLTFIVTTVSVGGAIFVVIFGDVIVCIWLILSIIKHIIKKRSNHSNMSTIYKENPAF